MSASKRAGITGWQGDADTPALAPREKTIALPLPTHTLISIGLPLSMENIRKLFFGGSNSPAAGARVAGLDVDDLFSEVLLGLVTRARMSGGYDHTRGYSPTTYVVMVMHCILRNKIQAAGRKKRSLFSVGLHTDVALTGGIGEKGEDDG